MRREVFAVHSERRAGVGAQVAAFQAVAARAEDDVVAVHGEPDGGHVRGAGTRGCRELAGPGSLQEELDHFIF